MGGILNKGGPPAAPAPIRPGVSIKAQKNASRYNIHSPFGGQTWVNHKNGVRVDIPDWMKDQLHQRNRVIDKLGDNVSGHFKDLPGGGLRFDAPDEKTGRLLGRMTNNIGTDDATRHAFNQVTGAMGTDPMTNRLLGRLVNSTSNDAGRRVEKATYRQLTGLLDPHFDREEERLDQKLANQGIPMGAAAQKRDLGDFATARDQTYQRAADDAITAGADERDRQFNRIAGALTGSRGVQSDEFGRLGTGLDAARGLQTDQFGRLSTGLSGARGVAGDNFSRELGGRQQLYNEIASMLSGTQINPVQATNGGFDTGNAFNLANAGLDRQFQGQMAGYNANVGRQNAMLGGLFNLGSAAILGSDRRLKTDIVQLGEIRPGINLYKFRYKAGGPLRYGVMADEVEKVIPEAIHLRDDGMKLVDYFMVFGSGYERFTREA